jgi:predicted ATPase
VFVTGEPGIGKSALVEAFLAGSAPRAGLRVAAGQCVEQYGPGEAYLPVLEALERLGRAPGGEAALGDLRREAPGWLAHLPALVERREHDALVRRLARVTRPGMLRELASFLEATTRDRPLVLWLEDLHWADPSTLDAIASVARRPEPARLLLLLTYRPADLGRPEHPLGRLKQELSLHGRCVELSLTPLPEPAVAAYLAARLPDGASAALARHVHARSDGNPLFMVTVIEDLLAGGTIARTGGAWDLAAGRAGPGGVPGAIRQLIEQQSRRLEEPDRRLLEVAAVAGAEFSAAVLAAGLEEPLDAVEARAAELARQGRFLRARGTAEWPDGTTAARCGFVHALHQEVLYEAVPAGRRRELHGRVAGRLERAYGEQAREIAPELAMHFERAGRPGPALRYLRLAGEQALARAAHAEAIGHLSQGLERLGTVPDGLQRRRAELELLVALGPAWIVAKGYAAPEVERTYQRALALCRAIGGARELPRVLKGLWNVRLVRGELRAAGGLARELLRRARREGDRPLLATAHAEMGETLFHEGELGPARRHLAAALARPAGASARRQDPRVASYASWGLWMAGYADRARAVGRRAVADARALGHPHSLAFALGFAGFLAEFCGDVDRLAELAAEQLRLCGEHGIAYWRSWAVLLDGYALGRRGRLDDGMARAREGLAGYRETGAEVGVPHFLYLLAELHGAAGRVEEGQRLVDEGFALMRRTGNGYVESELWRVRGELLGGWPAGPARPRGREAAAACFRRALASARWRGARALELRAATRLARLWRDGGEVRRARRLLAGRCAWFREGADTADLGAARALLGELAPARRARAAAAGLRRAAAAG